MAGVCGALGTVVVFKLVVILLPTFGTEMLVNNSLDYQDIKGCTFVNLVNEMDLGLVVSPRIWQELDIDQLQ